MLGPEAGYDRKRTEHAPSGDQLGWIEYSETWLTERVDLMAGLRCWIRM